jgi:hypothetical protein
LPSKAKEREFMRYMACSTIWNSMPNTIMPIAAATIGRRMMIAAWALLSGHAQC